MSYPVMPLGFLGSQGDQDQYQISRSLRFNSADSAYLNRTFSSPTTQGTFTLSLWAKLGVLGTARNIFGVSTNHSFGFTSGDALNLTFAGSSALTTTALFRDPSAWYHIVWTQSGTSHTLYVNGVSVGTATATSNTFNTAVAHQLGAANTANYFNGYLTEAYFIDGQALTPSSFGETDATTGRWKAKAFSGTYGTNGFYLNFSDNSGTTSATLGKDSAGSNDWTPNNFSVTAGAGNDSLVDSPTNWGLPSTNGGGEVRGNYCTANPNDRSSTVLANGNLDVSGAGGAVYYVGRCTISVSSGKWYWEALVNSAVNSTYYPSVGIVKSDVAIPSQLGDSSNGITYMANGQKYTSATLTNYGASFTQNDVIGMALDMDNGTLTCYKNGASQGQIATGLTGLYSASWNVYASTALVLNFGQRPFAYTAPSGFKALCTTNLPTPVIKKPSTAMDVVTYTGTGSALTPTSSLGFSPDLVWIKGRSGATDHAIYDTTRGVQNDLGSNLTTDETTQAQGVTAFNSDGFSIGTLAKLNTNSATYVGWAWDESAISGLDIVAYTGNGTARTIAHNLGVAPKMIIVKARTTASTDQGWPVYHASNTAAPETDYLLLNSTAATADLDTVWNDTAPTASVFSVGTGALTNTNNDTYIAYCFAEVEGYSKFGSYTGNGSADGPFVWCGFRPAFIMIKGSSFVSNWFIQDYQRSNFNLIEAALRPNLSNSEVTGVSTYSLDTLSNGFKLRTSAGDSNTSSATFIFAAFAEFPFKYARSR